MGKTRKYCGVCHGEADHCLCHLEAAPRTIIGETAVIAELQATIARLTAELAEAQASLNDVLSRNRQLSRDFAQLFTRAEAAEALLGAAYRAGLEDAAGVCANRGFQTVAQDIRAMSVPADLAARLAKEAGE